jgi:hypothetical protein
MKRDMLTILCMTLICASLMLGVMGVYKIIGAHNRNDITSNGVETSVFKIKTINNKM